MVASRLPSGTLQALLNTVVEFLQYHRQIEDDMDQEDGETDLKASFISRLESTVIGLRQRWCNDLFPSDVVYSGKSSLTVRFVERHFVESYYPTIENTFSHIIKSRGQEFATEIVDTAGQVGALLTPPIRDTAQRPPAAIDRLRLTLRPPLPHRHGRALG
ncbi:MAG: hypothetical protein Q9192_000510 [Flavoplaca navasiana]